MTPGDRAAQRPLSLGQVTGAPAEIDRPLESIEDRRRAEGPDAGGGQLDRQRQPGETDRDPADRRSRVVGEHEVRTVRKGTILEERDARIHAQGRDRIATFAADPHQLPARDQKVHVRSGSHQARDDVRGIREQLLQVVDDQEHRSLAEMPAQDLRDRQLG